MTDDVLNLSSRALSSGNPAAVLHQVLRALEQYRQRSIEDALLDVFQLLDPEDDHAPTLPLLFRRVAHLSALPYEAERRLRELENVPHDLLLRWREPVEAALAWCGLLRNPVQEMLKPIDEAVLYSLELCADTLDRYSGGSTIRSDRLPELVDLVRDVIAAVHSDAALPASARRVLIERLHEIERMLHQFRIVGYDAVEEELERLYGIYVAHPESRTPTVIEWLGKLWQRMQLAMGGTQQIANTATAVSNAVAALGVGDPGQS